MKYMFSLLLLAMSGTLLAQIPHPAAQAGASTNIAPRSGVSGRAISACGSITSPGSYYLSTNLTCPGTALLLSGPGIDLNLNGHTITYGTAGGTQQTVFGIENDACWDTDQKARTVACDNTGAGVAANIYNGAIVQSNRAPAFSDALFFGQNNNENQLINIHNVTITIQQTGTRAFYSTFQSGKIVLEHNTIHDNVKSINYPGQNDQGARAEFLGQAIHVNNSTTMRSPDLIDNNKIIGSPQGGIRDTSSGAIIHDNDISQNSTYANDFCVDSPGNQQQIYSNYCHPVNGRGIHVNGQGSHIYNNTIVVTEAPVNREYNGCEGGGAFGVQIEDDIHAAGGAVVTGNSATLNSGVCGGAAFRMTGWLSGSPATIQGNSWTVNKGASEGVFGDFLYSVDNDNLSDVKFGGDKLKTNDYFCAEIDWDGVQNFNASLASCTAPYAVYSRNGNGSNSNFKLVNAPNTNLICGAQATSRGTINGAAVKCPK